MVQPLRASVIVAAVAVATAIQAIRLAPATLADARVARVTGGALRLDATEGTIWRARGDLVAGTVRVPLAWRVEPWPLLQGELRVDLVPTADGTKAAPRADISVRDGHFVLRDVDVTVPASFVAGAVRAAGPWTVGGEITVTAAALTWAPPELRGAGRVQWRAARVVLADGARIVDLGDVAATLVADGNRLSGPVASEGGAIAVRGNVEVRAGEAVQLSLTLSPRDPADAVTAQLLSAVGAAEGSGRRIDWQLPLR